MICHSYFITSLIFLWAIFCPMNLQTAGKETTIQNPGFVEIAKCPCDTSENSCDFNCCCDKECTAQDSARFEACIPGLLGGQSGAKEAYKCGTKEFNPPDWHVLTCVFWENNPYLGMFFLNRAIISNKDAFTAAAVKYSDDEYSLSERETRYVDKEVAITDYRKGIVVTTRQPGLVGDQTYAGGLLALPQHINSGQCNLQAPVRFLEPVQSSCRSQLTTSSCSAFSSFSANIYAVSSAINTGTRPFQVTGLYKYKDQLIADANVRYFCAGSDYTDYLPSTVTPLNDLSSTSRSNFPADLQNTDCDEPCSDPTCWQYNTDRTYTPMYDTPLPAPCSINAQTLPPNPSLVGSTCQNVVLEVRYSFEWSGSKIERLTADVILADVTGVSTNTPIELSQRFSVNWMHSRTNTTTTTTTASVDDNFYNSSQPYQRSGIAGYEPDMPLLSGCRQNDSTGAQTVDTIGEKQMAIFKPGVDGQCANALREGLTFGQDVMSACALRLTFDDLKSCDSLRQLVGNHLNVLMPSDVIGRYGYNDPANQDMWISVLRQNLTEAYQSLPPNAPFPVNQTSFRLADHVEGICRLPTAVNLLVLYAKTGAINFHPRLEVIGAYVNFTFADWTMTCMGANSQRCSSASGQTQNFLLHSTVRFVEVPAVLPKPKDRFYTRIDPETCQTDSCERFYSFWADDVCYFDTCWQEIAYPLTSAYQGDSHEYALAFFLTLVLGVVGYTSVTKPGWN